MQTRIRERLENLKSMFDDEETEKPTKKIEPKTFDISKMMPAKVQDPEQEQKAQANRVNHIKGTLAQYLQHKIQETRQKQLDLKQEIENHEKIDEIKFQFKASTLSNIAPFGNKEEVQRLTNQFALKHNK